MNDRQQWVTKVTWIIANPPPNRADAKVLAALNRGYSGAVGNGISYLQDVALGGYASRVRSDALPRVLATFANLAIAVLHLLLSWTIKRTMNQLMFERRATAVMALPVS